jgi:GTP:adenosylcobinamide-phosphate guanylyltransferase
MDAVVIAGGIPEPNDPLYKYTLGKPKALLDICGKPMIQWVLDALVGAEAIDQIVIVGVPESELTCSKRNFFLPNQGSLLENVRVGFMKVAELNPTARYVLLVTSDIPAITPEMVDWVVHAANESDQDVCYTIVTRQDLEARYPGSKRPFPFERTRLKDIEFSGGLINAFRITAITENYGLLDRLAEGRRNLLKKIGIIIHYLGYSTLFSVMFGTIDSDRAAKRIAKRTGLRIRPVVCPYVEIAMDVDRPNQLEMLRKDMKLRLTQQNPPSRSIKEHEAC